MTETNNSSGGDQANLCSSERQQTAESLIGGLRAALAHKAAVEAEWNAAREAFNTVNEKNNLASKAVTAAYDAIGKAVKP